MKPRFKDYLWLAGSLLLAIAASALGVDGAFAMSEVVVTDDTEAARRVNDSKGDPTQKPGQSANRSDQVESGFSEEEIDDAIAEFEMYDTPAGYLAHELATKKTVTEMEVTHYRTATPVFEIPLLNNSDLTSSSGIFTLTSGTHVDAKLMRYLYEWKTVYVLGAVGYEKKGSDWIPGILALQVTKLSIGENVKLRVLNAKTGANATIPAGCTLLIGAIAASESQMIVAPDNFEPIPEKVYLQKRIFNVMFTDEFINGKNKVVFGEEDIRRGALSSYKINNEITDLLGFPTKSKVEVGNNMTPEYVYTTKGVLRQLNMMYTYDSTTGITPVDFTAISRMMFTRFAKNKEVSALCGSEFISSVLNMDLTVHKEIHFEDVKFGGMTLRGWKNNFGTIGLIYLPVLDLLHMSGCAVLIDWKNATCYMKRSGKTFRIDMKEGASDNNREAVRDVYSQIYGIALKGYNSLMVCPADNAPVVGMLLPNLDSHITAYTSSELPEEPSSGDILYLTVAISDTDWKAGDVIVYDGSNWGYYTGVVAAV